MALPICPVCGRANLAVVERANETTLAAGIGFPGQMFDEVVHRSYRCPCGWHGWSEERITTWRPGTTRIGRKFGTRVDQGG